MTREEKIKFISESAEEFGEKQCDWNSMSDQDLDGHMEWYDYLWEK